MNLRGSTLTRGRIDSVCLRQDGSAASLFERWAEDKTREATLLLFVCVHVKVTIQSRGWVGGKREVGRGEGHLS